jgi:hypothetical protein
LGYCAGRPGDFGEHTVERRYIAIGFFALVFWAFVFFWGQSGWYRVDCSLGIQKACELIQAEYVAKARP